MKKFILGVISGVLLLLATLDVIRLLDDHYSFPYYKKYKDFDSGDAAYEKDFPLLKNLSYKAISPGLGSVDSLSGRCTNDARRETTRRVYFQCNKLEIFISDLIYGEKDKR